MKLILIVITYVILLWISIVSGGCHIPHPQSITDRDYYSILKEHPVVRYQPSIKFGVVYNDYTAFSALYQFAKENIDHWRSKPIIEIIDNFQNSSYHKSFISLCSCSFPLLDNRYCCAIDECLLACKYCDQCIGSTDYFNHFSCKIDETVKDVMHYYSKLNVTFNNNNYRMKRKTSPVNKRIPRPRKCKNNVKYCSSSESDGSEPEEYNKCKSWDSRITERTYEGCKKWCPKGCECSSISSTSVNSKYTQTTYYYSCE